MHWPSLAGSVLRFARAKYWKALLIVASLGIVGCDGPIHSLEKARYTGAMQSICESIELYKAAHDGEVPTLSQLLDSEQGQVVAPGWTKANLLESFDIVALRKCKRQSGSETDSYVVVAKKMPPLANWGVVYVEGRAVNLN